MKTRNIKLNSLASDFALAIYHDITERNGGWFSMDVGSETIEVVVINGVKDIRRVVGYLLKALEEGYGDEWENVAISVIEQCVIDGRITDDGREIWQSIIKDMGNILAAGRKPLALAGKPQAGKGVIQ